MQAGAESGFGKGRLEAFSDGVIAIIITIMVLELKVPHEPTLAELAARGPVFVSYALSFLVVAIMWVNHHAVFRLVGRVDARMLWLNVNLLFWMSLIPFTTGMLGEAHGAPLPAACYGLDLALCGLAFALLRGVAARDHRDDPALAAWHARVQRKNLATTALYASAAPLAYLWQPGAWAIFVLIPAIYFFPDRRGAA